MHAVQDIGGAHSSARCVAGRVDDALDCAIVQERSCILAGQLPGDPFNTSTFQSDGAVHWVDGGLVRVASCLRRSKPVCVPKRTRSSRRTCFHGFDMALWVQPQDEVQSLLLRCCWCFRSSQSIAIGHQAQGQRHPGGVRGSIFVLARREKGDRCRWWETE